MSSEKPTYREYGERTKLKFQSKILSLAIF